jgi:hypothetical protein
MILGSLASGGALGAKSSADDIQENVVVAQDVETGSDELRIKLAIFEYGNSRLYATV